MTLVMHVSNFGKFGTLGLFADASWLDGSQNKGHEVTLLLALTTEGNHHHYAYDAVEYIFQEEKQVDWKDAYRAVVTVNLNIALRDGRGLVKSLASKLRRSFHDHIWVWNRWQPGDTPLTREVIEELPHTAQQVYFYHLAKSLYANTCVEGGIPTTIEAALALPGRIAEQEAALAADYDQLIDDAMADYDPDAICTECGHKAEDHCYHDHAPFGQCSCGCQSFTE